MPAPTSSAGPASNATSARTAQLRTRRRRLPQGEWEVLITDHHAGSSTGTPTRPTRPASAATSARWRTNPAPARSGRAARCCRAWPPAGVCGRKLAVYYDGPAQVHPRLLLHRHRPAGRRPRHPAPAGRRRRASTPRSPRRSWPRSRRPRCRPAWPPPGNSRTATTRRWHSTVGRSNRPATTPPRPNAATGPSTPTTGWSPAAWKAAWENALHQLAAAEAELARRETARPKTLTPQQKQADPGPR